MFLEWRPPQPLDVQGADRPAHGSGWYRFTTGFGHQTHGDQTVYGLRYADVSYTPHLLLYRIARNNCKSTSAHNGRDADSSGCVAKLDRPAIPPMAIGRSRTMQHAGVVTLTVCGVLNLHGRGVGHDH
jgi:hypothetical protein